MATYQHLIFIVAAVFIATCYAQSYERNNYQQNSYNRNDQGNSFAPAPSRSGNCPEANGTYPTGTCDGYIECINGVAEEKLCPDGLLFNPAVRGFPCQYPVDVDCTGRTGTQPPQATADCPHQFGYYKVGDESNCGQFMNCASGRGYTFDCPEGLAFNSESYRCDWPDQTSDCNAEAYLGFTCPPLAKGFLQEEYRYFKSPNDCQRYFICINGAPRMYNCGERNAYNEDINACDGAENVTGCAPAYNPEYDTKRGNQQQIVQDNQQYNRQQNNQQYNRQQNNQQYRG